MHYKMTKCFKYIRTCNLDKVMYLIYLTLLLSFAAVDFISCQLISIHRIPGQFVNKPGYRLLCDRALLTLMCEKYGLKQVSCEWCVLWLRYDGFLRNHSLKYESWTSVFFFFFFFLSNTQLHMSHSYYWKIVRTKLYFDCIRIHINNNFEVAHCSYS